MLGRAAGRRQQGEEWTERLIDICSVQLVDDEPTTSTQRSQYDPGLEPQAVVGGEVSPDRVERGPVGSAGRKVCLLYTSDAADE